MYSVLSQIRRLECANKQKTFFNGYISDYIEENNSLDEEIKTLFRNMAEKNDDIRICANYPLEIREEVVANQVIRYKDAFKIPGAYLCVPYIVYWQNGEESRAMIISDTTYIEAKGMYFLLTEPGSRFADYRNEVVACCIKNLKDVSDIFESLYQKSRSVGAIQRYYDRKYIINADEMKDKCVELGKKIFNQAKESLPELEDKSDVIYTTVGRVFLIKKALYVQYMMSKDILLDRHENDIKKQRQFAKAYVDEIEIISYSQLWRLNTEEQQ